ncbi:hypothetical protein ACQPXB_28135 [Amycolatopsis sp. CA-161197]|uniref:hypothetical protein n=1 Tax=Amycolatopsis sp. CA-161197 TaxID=3239922 RepID=UPI003D9509DA
MATHPRPARRRAAAAGLLLLLTLVLTSCAAGANPFAETVSRPGFWLGLWQGFICPITFLISLFNDHVGVYAVYNSGHLYDFGFVLGIIVGATVFRGPAYAQRRRARMSR